MDDREAIERYDRAGGQRGGAFPAVRWPDLALDSANLARLVEGVVEARCDCARLAFGEAFDASAVAERLSEAWRIEAVDARYAPEGVFVRAQITVRVELAPERDDREHDESPCPEPDVESLRFTVELCVSFTHRHHTRPFVDFMGGEVRRASDDAAIRLDPFAREISPQDAVEWGLNGSG